MSPARVLYVVSLFPCWSETFIVREIEGLIARGVDVRILSLRHPSEKLVQDSAAALLARTWHPARGHAAWRSALACFLAHPLLLIGTLLRTLAGLWRQPAVLAKTLVALWRAAGRWRELRTFAPELIHAHWATYPSTVAWALSRQSGIPFGFTSHAHDIFVEDQLLATKLAAAALPVTISRYNVAHLKRWMAPGASARLHVVRCGVDRDVSFVPDGRDEDHVVSVGRHDPIKGFPVLIEALSLLRARRPGLRCTIIGDGPDRPLLERLARSHGVADILDFAGAKPQAQVRALLARATVFAMPSVVTPQGNRDGIPVALMEAMAAGAAVAATRVSGIPELVEHERSGLLVEPEDSRALADALERLLGDRALRTRLALEARAKVTREFDASTESGRMLEAMSAALAPRPARVLVVSDEMEVGGSQRQIVHLLRGLRARGRDATLLYFRNDSFLVDEVRAEGVPVVRLDKSGRIDPRFFARLVAFLRSGRYDVVHCFSITAELWVWLALKLAPGARLIGSVRGLAGDAPRWHWWLKRRVLRNARAVIANSSSGAGYAATQLQRASAPIELVPNGLPFPRMLAADARMQLRSELGAEPGRALVLFVGRLVAVKNVGLLLDALARIDPAQRPCAAIAGDGPLAGPLQVRAHALGLVPCVRFLGERSDAIALMQAADLMVLPSHEEGLSNVLLEAMACGLPVVASDVGGNPELVEHERTGLLFAPGDADALASCVLRLVEDPALRSSLGEAARARVEREHAVETMVTRTLAVYDRTAAAA